MKLHKGHDTTIGDEGLDILLTDWEDGSFDIATRPGHDRTAVTWGPPTTLTEVPA